GGGPFCRGGSRTPPGPLSSRGLPVANPCRARTCLLALLTLNGFGLLDGFPPDGSRLPAPPPPPRALSPRARPGPGPVPLPAAAPADPHGLLLLAGADTASANDAFLDALRPPRVVPVGSFVAGTEELGRRLGDRAERPRPWKRGAPRELWKKLFPRAEAVVVC